VTRLDLGGRTAFVTGAARGIGFETARLLHARGAAVTITDLDADAAELAASEVGERALGLAGEATDRESLEAAVAATLERFGTLDIVVANAGIAPPVRTIGTMDPEAFERVVEVDLLGVYRTIHAALPQVAMRGGQAVILASVYAFANGALATPYAASKAAVEQLGRALRIELAPHGAGATVVYPGFADTRMVRDAFDDPVASALEEYAPRFVMRRVTPALVAERIVAGIERRAPRVTVPRWWAAYSALRGVLGPLLDAGLARDRRFHELLERAERIGASEAGRRGTPESTDAADQSSKPRSSA
jgi:NAD(P)-dependent dehydrogenase (short-subunit alcohol dehydrogenase family)